MSTYFISGAGGQLGRAVINHLLTTFKVQPKDIIAGTRDIAKLDDLKAKGVQVRAADFEDEAGLAKALAGASHFLIISTNALGTGQREKQHLVAVAAAEKAGVGHVIYTSMPKPETSAVTFAPDHLHTEQAIAASKIPAWTILRNNWYFENLFMGLPMALKSGTQYTSAGNGKIGQIGRDDLALAAANALVNAKPAKTTYTLSGTKAYTTEEIAALVSKATGKPLAVVQVPVEGLIQGMTSHGVPEGMAKMIASFDVNTAQGGLEGDAKDFTALTGKQPGSFEDWLKNNAAAFTA
ncbi:NmrA family NAD(P)-binding protein [Aestuariivirga litoralis]|uniref:NmrA family NAD(P)-binding protein n=1 Tax=Aestuariivirga litoralis TaxID=2650924 RepID=UPI0018C56895|nr:NmrA family NAD(P)-binding protein [Aestuariivirga litoralis]MBG1231376.1 NAD(P)H-binding protein [Aestuariivirga litoralis]